jgi:hypothetical protein
LDQEVLQQDLLLPDILDILEVHLQDRLLLEILDILEVLPFLDILVDQMVLWVL